jgi:hypothetical protein
MPTSHEVERLNEVYRIHRQSKAVLAQQSPRNAGNRAMARERMRLLRQVVQATGYFPLSIRCS